MSVMVIEIFEALRSVGVAEAQATAAAKAVMDIKGDLVTSGDLKSEMAVLRTEMAELKSDLIKWNVGTLIAMTAIYGGLVAALKLFA